MNKRLLLLFSFSMGTLFSMEKEELNLKKRKRIEEIDEHIHKKEKELDFFDKTIGVVLDKELTLTADQKQSIKNQLEKIDGIDSLDWIRTDYISLENFKEFNEKSAEFMEELLKDYAKSLKNHAKSFDKKAQQIARLTHYLTNACREGHAQLIPILVTCGAKLETNLLNTIIRGYNSTLRALEKQQKTIVNKPPQEMELVASADIETVNSKKLQQNPNIHLKSFLLPMYLKTMKSLIDAKVNPNLFREFASADCYDDPKEMELNPRSCEWILPLCVGIECLLPEFVGFLLYSGAELHAQSINQTTPYETFKELEQMGIVSHDFAKIQSMIYYHAAKDELWCKEKNYFFKWLPSELRSLFEKFKYEIMD